MDHSISKDEVLVGCSWFTVWCTDQPKLSQGKKTGELPTGMWVVKAQ